MRKYFGKIVLRLFSFLPSGMKIMIYRILGSKIEEGAYIGLGSYILPYCSGFGTIRIGKDTSIGDNVVITARKVVIGRGSEIKENVNITGESTFSMGEYSYIGEDTLINLRRNVTLGDEVCVGAKSTLYTHGIWLPAIDGYPSRLGEIKIKNNAWVSAEVFIMPGVTIGENAVVGSSAVVTKDVADNSFAAGNPAKEIRKLDPSKKPSLEEKNHIAREMMHEFAERFGNRVKVVEDSLDKIIYETSFVRSRFFILKKKEKTSIIYKKEVSSEDIKGLIHDKTKNLTIVSLSLEEGAKNASDNLSWIDLTTRKTHLKSNLASNLLMKSLKNNGLRFESK